ncbi:uncharacterized protein BXIN_2927 [Babesia sp. Xinjiang]|uniref:uncharacterized protein n=1 Tax=Babesia sp. Xinjiang TaxID=462227 RepID=UPI000A24EBB2|nr:uncharacterized protein BXIN_2927 [Babesia sp. Xinjiang]ORM39537.1 hypothetical protein BXIN_2927 [Babesia sp. Xinjiang]
MTLHSQGTAGEVRAIECPARQMVEELPIDSASSPVPPCNTENVPYPISTEHGGESGDGSGTSVGQFPTAGSPTSQNVIGSESIAGPSQKTPASPNERTIGSRLRPGSTSRLPVPCPRKTQAQGRGTSSTIKKATEDNVHISSGPQSTDALASATNTRPSSETASTRSRPWSKSTSNEPSHWISNIARIKALGAFDREQWIRKPVSRVRPNKGGEGGSDRNSELSTANTSKVYESSDFASSNVCQTAPASSYEDAGNTLDDEKQECTVSEGQGQGSKITALPVRDLTSDAPDKSLKATEATPGIGKISASASDTTHPRTIGTSFNIRSGASTYSTGSSGLPIPRDMHYLSTVDGCLSLHKEPLDYTEGILLGVPTSPVGSASDAGSYRGIDELDTPIGGIHRGHKSGKCPSDFSFYSPNAGQVLDKLITRCGLQESFEVYSNERFKSLESSVKRTLRDLDAIEHFRDEGHAYDVDEGLVADIVDCHDPGPYETYVPLDLALQTSDGFIPVTFENGSNGDIRAAHRMYGGWFEPQAMVVLRSSNAFYRDVGWTLSSNTDNNGEPYSPTTEEEVCRVSCSLDKEDSYLDATTSGTAQRFPLWYYVYLKTGVSIGIGASGTTFLKLFHAFDIYTQPFVHRHDAMYATTEAKASAVATKLEASVPVSSNDSIDLLRRTSTLVSVSSSDAVSTFQDAYTNLLESLDDIFSGDKIRGVPLFVKTRSRVFSILVTFLCLNILLTLLSVVSICFMVTKSEFLAATRSRVSPYKLLKDMCPWPRCIRRRLP